MKNKIVPVLLLLLASWLGNARVVAQTLLYQESFESDGEGPRYTSNTYTLCPTEPDYFFRTNTNPPLPSGCSVGFGSAVTGIPNGTFFWAGEDITSNTGAFPGARPAGFVMTRAITITNYTSLQFKFWLATGSNAARWETPDSINIQASIDSGPFRTVGRFMGSATSNGNLIRDLNLNGIADLGEMTPICDRPDFTQYTFNIPGSGSSLRVRLDFDQWGGTEETAFDMLEVFGTLVVCVPPSASCPTTQTLMLNNACQATLPDYRSLTTAVGGTCGPMTIVQSSPAIGSTQTGAGPLTVTMYAQNTALQGSTNTCTFIVNKVSTPPTITCPGAQTLALNSSCQATLPDYSSLASGISGSCNPVVTQSPAIGSTQTGPGPLTVSLFATNSVPQSATCTFVVNMTSPEMDVTGNSVSIPDGDVTPGLGDFTDFGSVNLPGNIVRTYTITNSGTGNLTLAPGSITTTGTDAAMFVVGGITLPITITPGLSTTFTVTFTPSSGGLKVARVNIANNDCNENPYDFSIQGTGVAAPEINVKGNNVNILDGDNVPSLTDHTDFGSQSVCAGTIVRTFTIENITGAPLTFSAPVISGTHAGDFVVNLAPVSPVNAGNSTTFEVTFNPSGTGLRSATITISNNDADEGTYDFAIQGTGNDPEANVTGNGNPITDGSTSPSLTNHTDFGAQAVCTGTISRTYTIQNTGNQPLTVGAISITGSGAADYNVTVPPSSPVAAASSTTFQVTFDPSVVGARTATVSIATNDCDENPYNFDITGSGTDPEINLQGNALTILDGDMIPTTADHTDFGSVLACTGTIARTFTIQNTGTNALTVLTIVLSGSHPTDYAVTGISLPVSVPAAGSTTFQVTFDPSVTGLRSATLTVNSNDCDEAAYDFAMQGTGNADIVNPAISCPANISAGASPGQCSATVSYGTPSGSDNCPSPTTTQTAGLASGAAFPVGVTTNVFRVTDGAGNTATCSFTVTVTDNILPTITCPANISVSNSVSACGALVTYTPPVGTDNCPSPLTTQIGGSASGSAFAVGVTTNVFRVTDAAGNTATCSFTVTVTDNELPVLRTLTCNSSDASGTDYDNGWQTNDNSGTGFGPWTLTTSTGNTSQAGFFVGNSTLNGAGTDTNGDGDVNTSGRALGMYANSSQGVDGTRAILGSFTIGSTVKAELDNGFVDNGQLVGFQLQNASGQSLGEVRFRGGQPTYELIDLNGLTPFTAVPFTDEGIVIEATSVASGVASMKVTRKVDGATQTLPMVLFPPGGGQVIARIKFFVSNAGTGASKDVYVNNMVACLATPGCPAAQSVNAAPGTCAAPVTYTAPVAGDNCATGAVTQTAGLASGASFPVGVTTNAFMVTDASGNTATCASTVTVVDNQLPTITCPANQSVNAGVGFCSATVTFTNPVGADNCAGPVTAQTAGLASGGNFPVGATTNTFRVTDGSGNTATCSFTVTVTDNQLPTITCSPNLTVATDPGQCSAAAFYSVPVGLDNCPSPVTVQTAGLASGATFPIGVTTNVFRVTDAAGNTATCSFTVTITDIQAPTITCPANISVNAGASQCSATETYTAPTGTDNCPSSTTAQTAGLASGATYAVGVTTNTFRVTDAAGNTATCSFTVTVVDNQLPTITCPANMSVNTTLNQCSGIATYTPPTGADNCSGPSTTQIAGILSGNSFPGGVTVNTFRVTDASGNTATCSFTVTVVDNQLPVITCPANQSVNAAVGLCSETVTYFTPGGGDNCAGPITTQTSGLAPGASFPVGVTTNTFTVTDAAGNTATCSFTVTVTDNQLPSITCPANIGASTSVSQCNATVSYTAPAGTDNCPGQATVQTAGLASGATFPMGVTTNTFRVTDAAGNTATCSFTVTVVDNQLPSITCPANQSANASLGICSATVTYTSPIGTDNCPGQATAQTSGLVSGVSYPVGVTTNAFRVTDAAGNTATCSFTVTVVDNQLPTITCPANLSVNASPSQCNATVTYTPPTGGDNCAGPVTTQIAGLASGATYPVGVTTNTFRVTDASGNTATCSFTISVVDNQLPSITCPANQSVNAGAGVCSATVLYSAPSGVDNCIGAVTTQTAGLASGASFAVGVTTNTFRVTDASGNTATCSFTVTVIDNQLPTITCPANMSVNATPGLCTAVVTYTAPSGTDNCLSPTTTLIAGLASGASYPSGVTTNTFRVTDASGNTATCSFTVTVVDNQLPSISCPSNFSGSNDLNMCSRVLTYIAPTGTDNCTGATTTQISGLPSGSSFPVGTTTNTFRVTDASGNTTTCAFTVVITDTQLPTISCPANQSVNAGPTQCTATVNYTAPVGADNCPSPSTTQVLGLASGSSFTVGTTINRFVVTDASGNTASCSFNVVVTDNQLPTITCPANVTGTNDPGLCSKVVTYTTPVGADNCTGASTVRTTGLASGAAFPVGTTNNTYRVTDASGNTASCAFTVTITDAELPTITCPANITGTNDLNLCSKVVVYTPPVGTDNCPSATTIRTAGLSSGAAFAVGTTTTTYRVTDASGNTATCSFTVVITDAQAPVINCPANITGANDLNLCSKVVTFTAPVGTDNCPGQGTVRTGGLASGSAFPVGTTTNTYQVTDAAGNTTTCSFTVVISDNQLPAITCPANITGNNDPNLCSKVVTYTAPVGTDNCPGQSTVRTTGLNSGDAFPVGSTTNTFIVTDAAGNTTTCAFTVVITDNQLPTISCPGNIVGVNDPNQCTKVVSYTTPVGGDNCAGQTTAQTAGLPSGSAFPVGLTTNTFRVTDAAGNSVSCAFTVVISDAEVPAIVCPANVSGNNDPGLCSKVVTFSPPVGTDNCPASTTVQTAGLISGAAYPVGTTTNAYSVTDGAGNSATCAFTVVVTDNEAPVLTCPPNLVLNADSSICGAVVNWTVPSPTDNCTMDTLISNQVPGAVFVVGTSFVTYFASDIHGNSSSCSFSVAVNAVPLRVVAISPLLGCGYHLACAGDTTASVVTQVSGGCLPYNYSWSNGSNSNSLQNLGAGLYVVTVTDGQQETWVDTLTITAPAPLVLVLTGDTLVCEMDSSGALGTIVMGGQDCAAYTYLWSTGSTSDSLSGLPAGNYTVVVTDTMGCSVADGRLLQLGINPILDLGADTTKCPGTTLVFEAPPIYSAYLWDNGTQNSTVLMDTAGDYICTVWTPQGCQDDDTVRVTDHVVDYDIITATGALQLCDGDTLILESDAGLTNIAWSTGATTPSIAVTAYTGLVTLQAQDSNGCATADTVAVSYTPILLAPVITPGPNAVLCAGGSLQLDLQAGYFGYLWSTGDSSQSIVVTSPGVYQATVSNGFGCTRSSDATTVVLGQLPTPTVTVGVNSLSTSPYAGYQWLLAGDPVLGAITISHQPITAGWYSVMVTDSNGCVGTSDSVYFNPVGVADQVADIQGLSIYPNPSRGMLNLSTLHPIDWPMTVEIWDMFGQKVKSYDMAHLMDVVSFDLQDLSSAPYLLKITSYRRNTTQQAVFRFVKE